MEGTITEVITMLVLQLAVIIFAVRIFGQLAERVGISSVLGELIAGILIGPYALGGIALPGFPHGIFPLNTNQVIEFLTNMGLSPDAVPFYSKSLSVSPELYAIGQIASIILLFASGLETDLSLFLKYSVSGGVIGLGGVFISFLLGDVCSMMILHTGFMDTRCLFLGIMSTATSVGITARILSDKKKMDSPEGVTILAAAVFDDVLGIVLLAVVMGITAALSGGGTLSGGAIGLIALRAFTIWLVATVVFILLSRKIARFVRCFGGTFDFSIAALGVALILSGIFEMHGLAMIIGAYTTGLALSSTDIAPVIEERIRGLYKFFVPVFFAVMGMSVDVTQLFDKDVLFFGFVYTVVAVGSKLLGCGGPALLLGFNAKGGFRIGSGMIPRGEVALIIAGIGLSAGIVDQKLFGVVILMTLVTTLVAPSILSFALHLKGRGTRKEVASAENQQFIWDFKDIEITRLVVDMFLRDLRTEGFYVQMMNRSDGLAQARKGDIAISIEEKGCILTVMAAPADMGFVKGEIYEVMLRLNKSLNSLSALKNTVSLQYGFASPDNRIGKVLYRVLNKDCICCDLKGNTKDEIFEELATLLEKSGCVKDKNLLVSDMKMRDRTMSTAFEKGIAIPHARTDGVSDTCVAVGIKKDGVDINSMDKQLSKIFVMIASPASGEGPQMRIMSAFTGALMKADVREKLIETKNPSEIIDLLREAKKL